MYNGYEDNDWYDTAQICKNGHLINDSFQKSPDHNKKHCDRCGEETITKCPKCEAEIKGAYHMSGVIGNFTYIIPSFCSECGNSYPWTERKLVAAKELVETIDGLTDKEKGLIDKDIDALIKDSPGTTVSATRVKAMLVKAKEPTLIAVREIFVDVASETAKKIILGN